ncbi:hypothetical protein SV97_004634 [Salmonella enterica subsp. enterica]|nr:hypothetical protein [Salmonella enterica subsp. enterica serovar Rubislaw]ECE0056578.1 hypothetical protein [Salmonella enterica subsp. enterica]EEJ7254771.1 hypothetical protein [Salmonella enterica subsp. enterica]
MGLRRALTPYYFHAFTGHHFSIRSITGTSGGLRHAAETGESCAEFDRLYPLKEKLSSTL